MDDIRIHRRTRARTYDLRRKVLLKNFLRDQMTLVPETSTESLPIHESSEESSSCDKDSSIAEVDPLEMSFNVIDDATNSCNDDNRITLTHESDSSEEIDVETIDNCDTPQSVKLRRLSQSPGLVKFTGFFKKDSKCAFKPKRFGKNAKSSMKTRSFKKSFEKVFYGHKNPHEKSSPTRMRKNSSRSLFSLFKHRREQRHAKEIDQSKKMSDNHIPNNAPMKSSSVSQSVQTDDSWVKEEMSKVHESNKRLKEENKLLSESLSYFMSNADPQVRQYNSQYQPTYDSENSLMFHDYTLPPSSSSQRNWNSNSRVSRSKSVHEFNERHKVLRNNYRTKSMNVHNSRNYFLTNSRPLLPSHTDEANISRLRKKSSTPNMPINSSIRSIQRRSSMPEKTLSENNRRISHSRSNSMRNTHTRKPFYALSADAFY